MPIEHRDLTVANAPGGGYLVQTDVGPGGLFVNFLTAALGQILGWMLRVLMQGNASIPAASGNVTNGWFPTEGTSLTESQFASTVAASTPKSVGVYTEASRAFMKSTTSFAQQYILRLVAQAVAAECMPN